MINQNYRMDFLPPGGRSETVMAKKRQKLLSLLLAVILAGGALVSCSDTSEESDTKTQNGNSAEVPSGEDGTDSNQEPLEIPYTNYNGYTFTALNGDNQTWNRRELVVEELNGEGINDAFFNRNAKVEELLNIKIASVVNAADGNASAFKTSVNSGDGAYECAFMNFTDSANVASGGYCIDINTLPYIDFQKSWWNSDSVEQLNLLNTNYLVASDITIGDKDVMWVLFFDKQYFEDLNLEDPYQLVADQKWTFDKFYDMLEQGLADLNGDGVYNTKDRYGLLTHGENYAGMWMSAGEALVTLNDEKMPEMTWNSERFNAVWEKISQIMSDEAVYGDSIDFISSGLREGNALFATEVVAFIRAYRENEREFGILPMPKFDEDQDRYYTYVAVNSDLMTVGKSLQNPERTGEILEALAAKGRQIIMPEYYDVSLKSKASRDEQSAASLDIIFTNRMYDLGVVFGWGGIPNQLKSPDANVATVYAKNSKSMKKAIQNTINNMMEAAD